MLSQLEHVIIALLASAAAGLGVTLAKASVAWFRQRYPRASLALSAVIQAVEDQADPTLKAAIKTKALELGVEKELNAAVTAITDPPKN